MGGEMRRIRKRRVQKRQRQESRGHYEDTERRTRQDRDPDEGGTGMARTTRYLEELWLVEDVLWDRDGQHGTCAIFDKCPCREIEVALGIGITGLGVIRSRRVNRLGSCDTLHYGPLRVGFRGHTTLHRVCAGRQSGSKRMKFNKLENGEKCDRITTHQEGPD
ncbi:hypothetical protein B0H13DRAFT_1890275 [Mycena leptocephala]|nr:hypothetical protein B0H13DRAFT_1890275 [Mycena leptocephala]